MSVATEKAERATNAVVALLREKGINRAAVVDDAYDLPARSDFENSELADFWADLDPDSAEQQEAVTTILGSVPRSEDEIDDARVAALYNHRNALGQLQPAFDTYLRATLERKHATLDPFTAHLRDSLGFTVQTRGTGDGASLSPVDIIFLDYYLGAPRDVGSVAAARDTARRLLKSYSVGAQKPLVVLMS